MNGSVQWCDLIRFNCIEIGKVRMTVSTSEQKQKWAFDAPLRLKINDSIQFGHKKHVGSESDTLSHPPSSTRKLLIGGEEEMAATIIGTQVRVTRLATSFLQRQLKC